MATQTRSLISTLEDNISGVLYGKREPIRHAIVALLAGGQPLIEDAPEAE